ncbi:MAG TPA: DUF5324 family protein [Marmoricola sp.]|nr:DUF5324 family protein [Marmoricola sp.]
MFGRDGGKNLRDQAQELADALAPHVDNAREQLAPKLEELREQLAPRIAEARDELAPRIEQAREQLAPMIAEAREKAAPRVAEARERFVNDVVPTVKAAVEEAREQAGPYAEEAKRRGRAAAAALAGEEPEKRKGGKTKWVLLGGAVAAGAVAWKRLMGDQGSGAWQSSYTPPPAPAPTPSSTSASGVHASDVEVDSPSRVAADDEAGASPGEAIADAAESPDAATTPDNPTEVVEAPGPEEGKKGKA